MNENKKPEGLWALKRPWDLPLKEYIKTFPLIVSIYNEDTLLHEEKIDYGIPDDRKLLGRLTFWACNEGYTVETMKDE